jgi:hypothetical protein
VEAEELNDYVAPTRHFVATMRSLAPLPVNGSKLLEDWTTLLNPIAAMRERAALHLRGFEDWTVKDHFVELHYDGLISLRRAARDEKIVDEFRTAGGDIVFPDLGALGDRFDYPEPTLERGDAFRRPIADLARSTDAVDDPPLANAAARPACPRPRQRVRLGNHLPRPCVLQAAARASRFLGPLRPRCGDRGAAGPRFVDGCAVLR